MLFKLTKNNVNINQLLNKKVFPLFRNVQQLHFSFDFIFTNNDNPEKF